MKILSIESATKVLSVALADENKKLALRTSDNLATHSETLLPMMKEMMDECGVKISDVDAIAVSNGPGSFTGLRIGVTTAKGLGLALGVPVIAVPTLEAMAYNYAGVDGEATSCDDAKGALICPMIDARRNQVFTGVYKFGGDDELGGAREMTCVMAECALDIRELIEDLRKMSASSFIFLGDGALLHKEEIEKAFIEDADFKGKVIFADGEDAHPKASSVARLGRVMAARGEMMNADLVRPTYLRQSQAEREYARVNLIGKKIISTTLDADNEGKVFETEDAEADIRAIAEIEAEIFGNGAWSPDSVRGHFSNPCNGALVARRGEEPCGFVLFQKIAGEGEVFRIAVPEKFRRCGIAKRLLSVLMQDSETDAWFLEVRQSNAPAISLYEAMGFTRERVIQDYYKDPPADALDMKRVVREIED